MKYYTLETITNGKSEKISKKFTSRNQAINYAFEHFEKAFYNDSLQIEEEFKVRLLSVGFATDSSVDSRINFTVLGALIANSIS